MTGHLDDTRRDILGDGSRMVPISTPAGTYRVWTQRAGDNPSLKVLLLHGGPGATREYLEVFDSWLPDAGIEFYYYDQLGAGNSDSPDDESLWDLDRYVDEVEQVRTALGLDGPGPSPGHGREAAPRPLPALPERQPLRPVRRPGDVLRRPARLPPPPAGLVPPVPSPLRCAAEPGLWSLWGWSRRVLAVRRGLWSFWASKTAS